MVHCPGGGVCGGRVDETRPSGEGLVGQEEAEGGRTQLWSVYFTLKGMFCLIHETQCPIFASRHVTLLTCGQFLGTAVPDPKVPKYLYSLLWNKDPFLWDRALQLF